VIGFYIDADRAREPNCLRPDAGGRARRFSIVKLTTSTVELNADFSIFIVTVPTSIEGRAASGSRRYCSKPWQSWGKVMRKGAIIVYESTVPR
jgi:UDP-N-acetyl-D-mannosaminuronate dehydrogenase